MNITAYQILLAEIALKRPYILSFGTVDKIYPVIFHLSLEDGCIGIAEAVALPGYSHETTESIIADLRRVLPNILKMNTEDLESYLTDNIPHSPFTISAILTATEFAEQKFSFGGRFNIPLVAPISAGINPREILINALELHKHGYRTIKLKVGRNIEHDCACISILLNEMPDDVRIRIDANQAYSFSQACLFLKALQHRKSCLVECFEQPFGIYAWQQFQDFAKHSQKVVPLMLDESIVAEGDIEKAAEVGADLIKLKLCKHRGIKGLISLAKKAKKIGLEVIIGNGVATEIGNIAEAVAFQQENLFAGAFEGNGFAKLSKHILLDVPKEVYGKFTWERWLHLSEVLKINKDYVRVIQSAGKTCY